MCYWSDSQTVLGNQKIPPKNCQYRRRILSCTNPTQSRQVNTTQNPADHFSRGLNSSRSERASEWLVGPLFWLHDEGDWPTQTLSNTEKENHNLCSRDSDDSNCMNVIAGASAAKDILSDKFIAHYRTLSRLIRAAAW